MDLPILPLIESYQKHVAQACDLFRTQLGVTGSILGAWNNHLVSQDPPNDGRPLLPGRGVLDADRNVTYSFHGIGCRVMFGSIDVDFDFGPDGRHDGFDAWRLHMYAKSAKAYRDVSDHKFIQAQLDVMERAKLIQHLGESLGSHLYYFTSALNVE